MKQVWKFPLLDNVSVWEMPRGAEILAVQAHGDRPCLWALVDKISPLEERTFRVIETSVEMPEGCTADNYVGTVQAGGREMHVFEG